MIPVSVGPIWQFLPSFHKKNTSVTNFPTPFFPNTETLFELLLIFGAVSKSRTRRFCSAYTAPTVASVYFGFVKTEHFGPRLKDLTENKK